MSVGTVYENFFSKEKNSLFFSDSEPMFTSSEIFCQSCETRNLCIRGNFWGKTIFEIYIIFHTFFGLWSKKRLVGKRFFPRVVTTAIRASRDFFWEKVLFFKKKFCLFICFGVWAIFLVYWQKTVRVSEKQPTNTEKSWTKKMVEKLFFKTTSDFQQKSLSN